MLGFFENTQDLIQFQFIFLIAVQQIHYKSKNESLDRAAKNEASSTSHE